MKISVRLAWTIHSMQGAKNFDIFCCERGKSHIDARTGGDARTGPWLYVGRRISYLILSDKHVLEVLIASLNRPPNGIQYIERKDSFSYSHSPFTSSHVATVMSTHKSGHWAIQQGNRILRSLLGRFLSLPWYGKVRIPDITRKSYRS